MRLEWLCRAALDAPSPAAHEKLIGATLLDCLRDRGGAKAPRLVRRD